MKIGNQPQIYTCEFVSNESHRYFDIILIAADILNYCLHSFTTLKQWWVVLGFLLYSKSLLVIHLKYSSMYNMYIPKLPKAIHFPWQS